MKFDYKALIRLMKKSYKGGGIKIIRTERELRDCFFLSGAGWASSSVAQMMRKKVVSSPG